MKIIVVSGYFDPLHIGHIEYFKAAKNLGDKLTVIVNSDYQAQLKKGKSFMPEKERVEIVKNLKMVDNVVLSSDADRSVRKTLRLVADRNLGNDVVFANGGDVDKCIEEEVKLFCKNLSFEYGVGGGKIQSSSNLTGLKARN